MKKVAVFAAALALMAMLFGCAPSIEKENAKAPTRKERLETVGEYLDAKGDPIKLEDVTADNWYKVRLTYPVDFIKEDRLETFKEAYEEVSVDDINRVSVVMSKEQYENLKKSADEAILSEFDACKSGKLDVVIPTVTDITYDDLYKEVYVMISGNAEKEQITSLSFVLCREVYTYKTLVGNNAKTKIIIVDADTQSVYGELSYDDVFDYLSKEEKKDES